MPSARRSRSQYSARADTLTTMPLPLPLAAKAMTKYKLTPMRWWILFLFCAGACLNNVICFSFAPISRQTELYYLAKQPISWLVTVFFISYIVLALPSSRLLSIYGLRTCFLIGVWTQAIGAAIRCLAMNFAEATDSPDSAFSWLLVGQTIASLGQGFFVNTPPLLSAVWFSSNERTLATTIACNFNTLGVAGAYAIAALFIGNSISKVPYASTIPMILAVIVAVLSTISFPDAPPSPPSHHAAQTRDKKDKREERTARKARRLERQEREEERLKQLEFDSNSNSLSHDSTPLLPHAASSLSNFSPNHTHSPSKSASRSQKSQRAQSSGPSHSNTGYGSMETNEISLEDGFDNGEDNGEDLGEGETAPLISKHHQPVDTYSINDTSGSTLNALNLHLDYSDYSDTSTSSTSSSSSSSTSSSYTTESDSDDDAPWYYYLEPPSSSDSDTSDSETSVDLETILPSTEYLSRNDIKVFLSSMKCTMKKKYRRMYKDRHQYLVKRCQTPLANAGVLLGVSGRDSSLSKDGSNREDSGISSNVEHSLLLSNSSLPAPFSPQTTTRSDSYRTARSPHTPHTVHTPRSVLKTTGDTFYNSNPVPDSHSNALPENPSNTESSAVTGNMGVCFNLNGNTALGQMAKRRLKRYSLDNYSQDLQDNMAHSSLSHHSHPVNTPSIEDECCDVSVFTIPPELQASLPTSVYNTLASYILDPAVAPPYVLSPLYTMLSLMADAFKRNTITTYAKALTQFITTVQNTSDNAVNGLWNHLIYSKLNVIVLQYQLGVTDVTAPAPQPSRPVKVYKRKHKKPSRPVGVHINLNSDTAGNADDAPISLKLTIAGLYLEQIDYQQVQNRIINAYITPAVNTPNTPNTPYTSTSTLALTNGSDPNTPFFNSSEPHSPSSPPFSDIPIFSVSPPQTSHIPQPSISTETSTSKKLKTPNRTPNLQRPKPTRRTTHSDSVSSILPSEPSFPLSNSATGTASRSATARSLRPSNTEKRNNKLNKGKTSKSTKTHNPAHPRNPYQYDSSLSTPYQSQPYSSPHSYKYQSYQNPISSTLPHLLSVPSSSPLRHSPLRSPSVRSASQQRLYELTAHARAISRSHSKARHHRSRSRSMRPAPGVPDYEEEDDDQMLSIYDQLKVFASLCTVPGFVHCLIVFSLSEALINAFSALLDAQLGHIFLPETIGMIGIWFIVSGMFSSTIFSMIIDRTRWYKRVTLFVFVGAIISLVAFTLLTTTSPLTSSTADMDGDGINEAIDGIFPSFSNFSYYLIYTIVIVVGFFLCPLQPNALEAAAECTYPLAEELSATMLQLTANVASAIIVPVMMAMRGTDGNMTASNWLVVFLVIAGAFIFASWPERLLRYESEILAHEQQLAQHNQHPSLDHSNQTSSKKYYTTVCEQPAYQTIA